MKGGSKNSKTGQNISEDIKNIDVLGEKFKMSYSKTASRFQTRIGGCLTILIIILALVSLVLISAQYFDTSSPVVTTSLELLRSAQSLNLYEEDLFSGITVGYTNSFEPLKMNKYITIRAQVVQKTFDPSTNSTKTDLSKKYNYIPCYYLKDGDRVKELVKKIISVADIRLLLCSNFEEADKDIPLSYDPDNLSSSSLNIKFYPCSLPEKNECYPVRRIFGADVVTSIILSLISPSEYDNPVVLRWIHPRYLIDITRTKSFRYYLQQNQIIDDRHFFKKPEIKAEYGAFQQISTDNWPRNRTQLYCTTAMIDAGECEEYFDFVYEMSNEAKIVTRRYKKIPVLMGQAGGVLKLLTTVFVLVSFWYSRWANKFLFRKAFNIKPETLTEVKKIIDKEEALRAIEEEESAKREKFKKWQKIQK